MLSESSLVTDALPTKPTSFSRQDGLKQTLVGKPRSIP